MTEQRLKIAIFIGWTAVVYGAGLLGTVLPILYMLLMGQVEAGESYYLDDLAPTLGEAATMAFVGVAFLSGGFVVKEWAQRARGHAHNGQT